VFKNYSDVINIYNTYNDYMKQLLFFLMLLVFTSEIKAQSLYFLPLTGNNWDTMSTATLGWCAEKVNILLQYLESKNTKSFIVLKDGKNSN